MNLNFFKVVLLQILFFQVAYSQFGKCGTLNGVELPCSRSYLDSEDGDESLPLYPYAKRPNGCSIPFVKPGEGDNFASFGYNFSFKSACNKHDRCYYTLGSSATQCNDSYTTDLLNVCSKGAIQPFQWQDLTGIARPLAITACLHRAIGMGATVTAAGPKYHSDAQQKQKKYLDEIDNYLLANYGGNLPYIKDLIWSTPVGYADRFFAFAKILDPKRQMFVNPRNNGMFYAVQLNEDGTYKNYSWQSKHGFADRAYFANIYGDDREEYITLRFDGTIYVTQLNPDGTVKDIVFKGPAIESQDRYDFADLAGNGKKVFVVIRKNGNIVVCAFNDNSDTPFTKTISSNLTFNDNRWKFAKVFGYGKDVYVQHRNNGTFTTAKIDWDPKEPLKVTVNNFDGGSGIADQWDFADIFGEGRDVYVTHRGTGEFYASRLNDVTTSTESFYWTGGQGTANRAKFVDFFGNGRKVWVTQNNTGTFDITQLNQNKTVSNSTVSLSNVSLRSGTGVADRWDFADVFGKGQTAYITQRNNGTFYLAKINSGGIINDSNLVGTTTPLYFAFSDTRNKKYKIELSGGSGDADLYVRKNSQPTQSAYDCRPFDSGNNESCFVGGEGTYYIMVNPYRNFEKVNLKVTVTSY